MPLSTIFQLYCGSQLYSNIGGGNRSTRRKSQTGRNSLTNFYHINVVSTAHYLSGVHTHSVNGNRHWLHRWSNYHAIM